MNLNILGLKPISSKNTYFSTLDDLRKIKKQYSENLIKDFRTFDNMMCVNSMPCLKALKLINSTFNLNLMAYKKLLRGYYIYFDGVMTQLSEIPFSLVVYIYNHIFWAQDSSSNEIKVNDINMFKFEGI